MPGGFEEPDAAVEIDAPEPLRIIAFAATIASGQVIESGMDDGIDPVKQVMAGSIRIERCGAKRHRPGRIDHQPAAPSGNGDIVAGIKQRFDDVAPDEAGTAGDQRLHLSSDPEGLARPAISGIALPW
jgi:hypothetical protein